MEGGTRAELVDLMMNLIENPGLVVIDGVVLDCFVNQLFLQSVDHFNLVKINHDTTLSSTGDVRYSVSLDGCLNHLVAGHERHFRVPTGLGNPGGDGTTVEVNSDVAFLNLV